MKLYHGSSQRGIRVFEIQETPYYHDLGPGIYLTSFPEQARKWSLYNPLRMGAVYEFEIDLSDLETVEFKRDTEDLCCLLYLCRLGIHDVAAETIERFENADVVIAPMLKLKGNYKKYERIADLFNEGELSIDVLRNHSELFDDNYDQYCFKSDKAVGAINRGFLWERKTWRKHKNNL